MCSVSGSTSGQHKSIVKPFTSGCGPLLLVVVHFVYSGIPGSGKHESIVAVNPLTTLALMLVMLCVSCSTSILVFQCDHDS